MKHRLVGLVAGLVLLVASLGGGFATPAEALVDCEAERRYSRILGIPSEGAIAWCNSSTGGRLVRGHHHNFGRDLVTVWFNKINLEYLSATSYRMGWVGLDGKLP
ncbi:MAG: hypothetical protein ACK5RL_08250 [Acidimicrobiales bacterium]